jgi:hypothetical protein
MDYTDSLAQQHVKDILKQSRYYSEDLGEKKN